MKYTITLKLKNRTLNGISFFREEDAKAFVKLCYFMNDYVSVEVKKE